MFQYQISTPSWYGKRSAQLGPTVPPKLYGALPSGPSKPTFSSSGPMYCRFSTTYALKYGVVSVPVVAWKPPVAGSNVQPPSLSAPSTG